MAGRAIGEEQIFRLSEAIDDYISEILPAVTPAQRSEILRLALRHKLTAYDATYLEAAIAHRLPLASFDSDLVAAAKKESVQLAL